MISEMIDSLMLLQVYVVECFMNPMNVRPKEIPIQFTKLLTLFS
jgi:hypothetical protein